MAHPPKGGPRSIATKTRRTGAAPVACTTQGAIATCKQRPCNLSHAPRSRRRAPPMPSTSLSVKSPRLLQARLHCLLVDAYGALDRKRRLFLCSSICQVDAPETQSQTHTPGLVGRMPIARKRRRPRCAMLDRPPTHPPFICRARPTGRQPTAPCEDITAFQSRGCAVTPDRQCWPHPGRLSPHRGTVPTSTGIGWPILRTPGRENLALCSLRTGMWRQGGTDKPG